MILRISAKVKYSQTNDRSSASYHHVSHYVPSTCPQISPRLSLLFLQDAISRAVEKSNGAKIESVAWSETYSSVTGLKVSKVRSKGWAARLKATELPVGINPGALGDTVTSGSRLALPQSNLDRSTMHKWSNDPRAVHKLVTYSVTMLSGTLGAISLRALGTLPIFLSVSPSPIHVLFSSLFRLTKWEMYRAVTLSPVNPSEWAVPPPWRTYRTNFAPVRTM